MTRKPTLPAEQTLAHFREHGWLRLPRAFDKEAAAAMRDAVWAALAEAGIHRELPSSWTEERPVHLQRLKHDPVFLAAGSATVLAAIDELLEGKAFEIPRSWGSVFAAFPSDTTWAIPTSGWHIDAKFTSPLWPARGVKTFALFGDVAPRGGGTLLVSGSHRLVHRWFQDNPPPPEARSAEMRKLLLAHPYILDLHQDGDSEERIARFMERAENWDGIKLRVVEAAGEAGDVYLLHPLVMHVAAANNSSQPRFLLTGGATTDMWGWQAGD